MLELIPLCLQAAVFGLLVYLTRALRRNRRLQERTRDQMARFYARERRYLIWRRREAATLFYDAVPRTPEPADGEPYRCGDPDCWVCAERDGDEGDQTVGTTTTEDDPLGGWCR